MKPYLHSRLSVKKYGGEIENYQKIHDFIDSSKAHVADVRHRALLHSSFGIYLIEQVFGITLINSDKQIVQVRDIAEDHVLQDLGFIPTVQDYLKEMELKPWMGGQRTIKLRTTLNAL